MRIKTESKLIELASRLREALDIIDSLLEMTKDECYQPGGKKDRIRDGAVEFRNKVRREGVE